MKQKGIEANWNLGDFSVESIAAGTDEIIRKATEVIDRIAGSEPSYENTIQPLIDLENYLMIEESPLDFIQHSSPVKELREASVASSKKLNAFYVEMAMRKDNFDRICAFKELPAFNDLTQEQKRMVEKIIVEGKRNGLHLDEEARNQIKAVKTKISELQTEYSSNLNEENTCLYFSKEELAGVPQDLVDSFETNEDGKCKVTLKYPHFFPVTRNCRVPETRKTIETAYQSRCMEENTKILEELIVLRQKKADLLGYENHAHYVLELRMAKSPKTVKDFLEGLATKLQPLWAKEKEEILKLKEDECKKYGYEYDGKVNFWDSRYYLNMVEETRYAVDKQKLKEYFPLEKVTAGLLEIYQEILGVTFTECQDVDKWHEEVKLYQVQDAVTKDTFGYFYLDLHPRDGKYGHAAVFPIQPGWGGVGGKERQPSVCAMMANFSKSTANKPALLDHDEVETYFHEFGHVMHNVCSFTETPKFAFLRVERDFVEAPSQMLENWCWEEEPLRKMSSHFKDNSPIPQDLMEKLIASRKANAGAFNLRQIILGTFDQRVHSQSSADTAKVFSDIYSEILGIPAIPGTNMTASWGHMCGYDAQYYGYMWSDVYSSDMFESRFKKEGLFNPEVGKAYRDEILKPGASRDAMDMLRNFLGREPSDEAFLRSKGLAA